MAMKYNWIQKEKCMEMNLHKIITILKQSIFTLFFRLKNETLCIEINLLKNKGIFILDSVIYFLFFIYF